MKKTRCEPQVEIIRGNQQAAMLASYRFLAQVPSQARHTVLLAATAFCHTIASLNDQDNCPLGGRLFFSSQLMNCLLPA